MAADWKKMQAKFEVWLAKLTDGPSLDPDADDVALTVIAALSSLFDEVACLKCQVLLSEAMKRDKKRLERIEVALRLINMGHSEEAAAVLDVDAPQRVDRDALNRQRVTQVAKRFVREARIAGTEGWTMGLLDLLHELECALENERP